MSYTIKSSADVVYAVNVPRFSYRDLYRLVETVSLRHGEKVDDYLGEYDDWDWLQECLNNAYAYGFVIRSDGWFYR